MENYQNFYSSSMNIQLILMTKNKTHFLKTIFTLVGLLVFSFWADAQLNWNKVFSPDEIGPGSTTTLTFTINNTSGSPERNVAFTDNLPAGVTIATVPNVNSSGCGGANASITAPAGGSSISLSSGGIAPNSSCIITVSVTSSAVGMHTNLTLDLTSDSGNFGTATDDLNVVTSKPGFTKSFAPNSINLGEKSVLTFTIDNTANASNALQLNFSDNLPTGLVVANPSNANHTGCDFETFANFGSQTLTAVPGSGVISFNTNQFSGAQAGSNCIITVDVEPANPGTFDNVTSALTVSGNSSGFATDVLTATVTPINIQKSFTNDPTPPGQTVILDFTLTSFSQQSASNISFTDDLTTALAGLTFTTENSNSCGGTLSGQGTTMVTYTGGSLGSGANCTISITCTVPGGATPGTYTNTTSTVTGDIGGSPVTGNQATDDLIVSPAPSLTKSFTNDPVTQGNTVDLEFTLTNTSTMHSLTSAGFTDELDVIITGASNLPAPGFCGGSSTISFQFFGGIPTITVANAELAASASCTFTVTLQLDASAPGGTYPNVTSNVTGTVNGQSVSGPPATDDLTVLAVPKLTKSFLSTPKPGETVDLEFKIEFSENAPTDATNISFTDDLTAMGLPGLIVSSGGTQNNICGTGSSLSVNGSNDVLTFSSGTLAPGGECTFTVTLQVPGNAAPGTYTNTTSNLTATVASTAVTGTAATADLLIAAIIFTKEFLTNPVLPGGTTMLEFTIEVDANSPTDATNIFFQDDLAAMLTGATFTAAPSNGSCGAGSVFVLQNGNTRLQMTGGSVAIGSSCTFQVEVNIPASAVNDTYINATSINLAFINSTPIFFSPAVDQLVVDNNLLDFSKEFTDDPVLPGSNVTLEFTIDNLDNTNAVSGITFTDDLDAVISGMVATGLPTAACGGTLSGNSTISLTGGSLAPGASCTFTVNVSVPNSASAGAHTNETSIVTGTINGLGVEGPKATDDLIISSVNFTKAFGGEVKPGCTTTLDFTITNFDAVNALSNLSFNDDLDAVLSGLEAVLPAISNTCGGTLSGTGNLLFNGGSLAASSSCTISVTVQVPCTASTGIYVNTTSELAENSFPFTGVVAQANLVVSGTNTAPTITCPDNTTVECDESSASSATGIATATDDCTATEDINITESDAITAGTCPQESVITRTWTATDECGNSNSCDQTISIVDTEAPTITCPDDVTIECDESSASSATGVATATDNCADTEDITISESDATAAGTCPQESVITRTWTATDECGNSNSCDQTITIDDSEAPTITCPDDVTVECDESSASSDTGTATASDNCADTEDITISESDATAAGSCPQESVITRTWTATDECGNSNSCDQTITIEDTEAPTITCPDDVTIECDESSASSATGIATATDNCADTEDITISESDATVAGSCPQESVITRTWTATDECGNSNSCDQTITIVDTTAPTPVCQDLTVELDNNGNGSITPAEVGNGSNDNCSNVSLSLDNLVFTCDDLGENTVTLTTTDDCGNSDDCDATITVEDNIKPSLSCSNVPSPISTDEGECFATIAFPVPTVDDNCTVASLEAKIFDANTNAVIKNWTTNPDGEFDPGDYKIRWRVKDQSNNKRTCNKLFSVVDDELPDAKCKDVTLTLSGGSASITVADVDDGSTDNCGIDDIEVSPNTFDCSNVGANTVTLTVTDIYGNVNTCNPNITINGTAVTISDESHAEGTGAGFTFYFFKIERGDNNCTFTMTNATADGTATLADNDYVQASGTQYFIAGSSNVRYFITRVVKDSNVESDEDFLVNLSSSSSIPNFVNTPGIGTIINDDSGGSIWGGNDDEICDGIDNDGDGQIDENLYNEVFNGNIVLSNQQEVNQFQDCIREINGYLFITGKDITDVSALNNLTSVSKDMVIMNTGLSTLRGLDKLVQVKGILQIIDNHQLTSLIGLQNLKFIGNELNILENPVLNHCCPIQPLLRNGGVQNAVYVTGNDTECEHPNEIDAACSNVFDGTIQGNDCPDCPVTTKVRMDVFPNPASNELNVVVNQSDGKGKLKMVDALGRELISLDLVEGQLYYQFETSNFKRGVYMIYVQTGKEIQSKKVTLQ